MNNDYKKIFLIFFAVFSLIILGIKTYKINTVNVPTAIK